MWAARGPPRILRSAPGAVVCASADGVWKADVLLDAVHLRCYQIKDDYPAVYALDRPANPPIAAAFKAPRASRLAVLTETSLEMYLCASDIANGVTFTFALSITLGTKGVEVATTLAANEQHLFIGTSLGRMMVFQWADLRAGGHFVSPLDVLGSRPAFPVLPEPSAVCSIACSSATYVLTSLVYVCVSFANGFAVLMSFAPTHLRLEEIVWLNEVIPVLGDVTTCHVDGEASLVALGSATSVTTLLRLRHKRPTDPEFVPVQITEHATLSLALWGFTPDDLGAVTALAFTDDGRAIAVGFGLRGMAVFSIDSCKLMSTLPQQLVAKDNELLRYGVSSLQWTNASSTLLVTPRVGNNTPPPSTTSAGALSPTYALVHVEMLKEQDGLCLSLAGEPKQCGAWVRSEAPFVPQPSNGLPGPAERSGQIDGGDLVVAINDQAVAHLAFDDIVAIVKELPLRSSVKLSLLRIDFAKAFSLATLALQSHAFCATHKLALDEDHVVWEYALRMQATVGDCVTPKPSMLAFEERAKFDGYMAIAGLSSTLAMHRYLKLYLSCFPRTNWQPIEALDHLVAFHNPETSRLPTATPTVVLIDFARSVLPMGKSDLHLLEASSVHVLAANCKNDPCGVLSSIAIPVPSTYTNQNSPMQLLAVSADDTRVAVAGARGFALLHKPKGTWLCFGNVHDEQAFRVVAMEWWHSEALVALVLQDDLLLIDVYGRDRLDVRCCRLVLPPTAFFYALAVDHDRVYCLSLQQLLVYRITTSKSADTFTFEIAFERAEALPRCNAMVGQAHFFVPIPRLTATSSTAHMTSGAWFHGWLGLLGEADAPMLLPRFALLDTLGSLYVWDPETKEQVLLASDISHVSTWRGPSELPTPCTLMHGLYGPKGFQAWWPLLDGVDFEPKAPGDALRSFLQVHDPPRARRMGKLQGASEEVASTYYQLLAEYGVRLEVANAESSDVPTSVHCIMVDPVLKFNPEVQLVGIHARFGVLVGAFQDQYVGIYDIAARVQPLLHSLLSLLLVQKQATLAQACLEVMNARLGLTTPTKELVLVTALDNAFRRVWPAAVVERTLLLLQDPENEMETYCEIVANVARKVEPNRLPLLFPLAGDPSALLQLCRQRHEVRTAANFLLCLDESVSTPTLLNRTRTNSFAQFQSRSALALELIVDCVECDEDHLALQLVRVARAWEPDHYYHASNGASPQYERYIDEQLGKYAFQMLVQYRFDKVVWLVSQTQVPLPVLFGDDLGVRSESLSLIHERLDGLLTKDEVRLLHAAVSAAKYEQWATLLEAVRQQET
ncbi:hypothetical protein SDRG_09060 [Saprolegnia diclina VS20]|uniref:PDZ domain-containing protein n=1 Tax=Saprolegnia diclina (strain VS20) TaxID=1156394 RepID=T0Q6T4_SAPDV|nr:hypothetical protein SDRG_09060 [Saprolegnia diclina VS20]EQC33554.1 hypothetical protein SDRG_09060 [Saprolegnia diclina VS20]|eukprot:XP_008613194.1 hypothetical protein SDRG_09060 [Saprolegnia diclina VS20]